MQIMIDVGVSRRRSVNLTYCRKSSASLVVVPSSHRFASYARAPAQHVSRDTIGCYGNGFNNIVIRTQV